MSATADYFAQHAALLAAHPGAAREEFAILKMVEDGTPSGPTGMLGAVYMQAIVDGVPDSPNEGEAYRLTHMVLFATDFGRVPVQGHDKAAWQARLQELAERYEDHGTLLGEVLMCAHCLDVWGTWADLRLAQFNTLWLGLDRTLAGFNENYHPILVGGLLAAMLDAG